MLTIVALAPLAMLLFLMVALEKPAYVSAPLSLALTSALALLVWGMDFAWFLASLTRGLLISIDIIFIVIGVLFLTLILKEGNAFTLIKRMVSRVSPDVRVQTILMSWFLVAFVEGVAGFGTPSMIAVPLMVALGLSPLSAVVSTVIADGVAVTFGAVGVPMTIGIAEGVHPDQLQFLGNAFVTETYLLTSFVHIVFGTFVPLVILCFVNFIYDRSIRKALAAWKLALLSGLLLTVPSFLIAYAFGPEFPSILGSLIGAALFILLVKKRIFVPSSAWTFEEEPAHSRVRARDYARAVIPYALVIFLLILSRTNVYGFGSMLRSLDLSFANIAGTQAEYALYPLYSSGFFFILASLLGFMLYSLSRRKTVRLVRGVFSKTLLTFISLVSVIGMVQIFVYSDHNLMGYPSFSFELVSLLTHTGALWPIFSPIVGLFGAFLAGSSTVSNLMFSSVQVEVALTLGMPPVVGLMLQSIGSAAGNMIAVHNIIAASSVVHLSRAEGKVIKYNIIPSLGYAFGAGILALLFLK